MGSLPSVRRRPPCYRSLSSSAPPLASPAALSPTAAVSGVLSGYSPVRVPPVLTSLAPSGPDVPATKAQRLPADAGWPRVLGDNHGACSDFCSPEFFADCSRVDVVRTLAAALRAMRSPLQSGIQCPGPQGLVPEPPPMTLAARPIVRLVWSKTAWSDDQTLLDSFDRRRRRQPIHHRPPWSSATGTGWRRQHDLCHALHLVRIGRLGTFPHAGLRGCRYAC